MNNHIEIKSVGSRGNFRVEKNGKEILTGDFSKYFHRGLTASFNNEKITIKPKDFWQSEFEITKNDNPNGKILFNWYGRPIIKTLVPLNGKKIWTLIEDTKTSSVHFKIMDESSNILFIINTEEFKFRDFKYNYHVELANEISSENEIIELILLSMFTINVYKEKDFQDF